MNAVLRRVTQSGREMIAELDTAETRRAGLAADALVQAYGEEAALGIVRANGQEPALDLTVKSALPNGRRGPRHRVAEWNSAHDRAWPASVAAAGFAEGA